MANPMPVTVGILSLDEYAARLESGSLLSAQVLCPRCRSAWLQQSGRCVCRPVVLLRILPDGHRRLELHTFDCALAWCRSCKHRPRILPACVLPRKRYGLRIQEFAVDLHVGGASLRQVAWREFAGNTFAHSTLHAWTEGAGSWALGREPGTVPRSATVAQVAAEAESRFPEARQLKRDDGEIDPERCRSLARRERLLACVWLVALAVLTAGSMPRLLAGFVEWTRACHGFSFRTGRSCTRTEHVIQQQVPPSPPGLVSRGENKWPTRGRSPPGAGSRSAH